jgi:UDP:flavonoid glycosyltransferase YjiC (YdhE family)
MARILIGTFPADGHVNPFFPLVRALVARGHEVVWNTGEIYRERVQAAGARFAPFVHAHDYSGLTHTDTAQAERKGLDGLKNDIKQVFIENAPRQMQDLEAINRDFHADALLIDTGFIGGSWFHQQSGLPLAVMNVLPMALTSPDAPPNGVGLVPSGSPLNRLRNRALYWAFQHVVFRDVQQYWNATRAKVGLPRTGWFQDTATICQLYMQLAVPGFEFPRGDLIPHAHFIGAMPAVAPQRWQAPEWWGELDGPRPVVHVTQGTVANAAPRLIKPALEGLAGEDVLVVVTTGGRPVADLNLGALPANARVATFLSYPELLPRTAAMVTNGGYGGTQQALAHGIPLAIAGTTEDKPDVAARVAWSGAGINLKTDAPTPEQVRASVRALLDDAGYRQRAQALQAEYARYDAVELGASLIERLAATGRPVLRPAAAAAPRAGQPAGAAERLPSA